jgi:hypothetical protein
MVNLLGNARNVKGRERTTKPYKKPINLFSVAALSMINGSHWCVTCVEARAQH